MGGFDEIADRRIRAGQEAGAFDDLDGAGRPIRDIDKVRPPGWWAARLAAKERHKLTAEELTREIADVMPTLWREATEAGVRERVDRLNADIERYNTATNASTRSTSTP